MKTSRHCRSFTAINFVVRASALLSATPRERFGTRACRLECIRQVWLLMFMRYRSQLLHTWGRRWLQFASFQLNIVITLDSRPSAYRYIELVPGSSQTLEHVCSFCNIYILQKIKPLKGQFFFHCENIFTLINGIFHYFFSLDSHYCSTVFLKPVFF